MSAQDWLDDIDETELAIKGDAIKRPKEALPQYLLPLEMLEASIGVDGIKRMRDTPNLCVILKVPGADWVDPFHHMLHGWGWNFSYGRSTPLRGAQIMTDETANRATRALAGGGRVIGISQDPVRLLPPSMRTSVDISIELPPPTGRIIAKVIEEMTGHTAVNIAASPIIPLEFHQICACLRHGENAEKCEERIERAIEQRGRPDASTRDLPHVRDLHGYGEARTWAMSLIQDLEAWRRGEILFSDIDANVVLASEPGLGKSTFARSVASSAGLPLVATSVSQWFSAGTSYLDGVIKEVDRLFDTAKSQAPAILFLDEIDAIPNRATIDPRGADWWLPLITHILIKLDGAVANTTDRIVIMGATNHPEKLDAALVRPGRLNRIIHIERPDVEAMKGILRQHLGPDLAGEDITTVAQLGAGQSGAAAVQWLRSARRSARSEGRPMTLADLLTAVAPIEARSPDLQRRIAIHEASHAVVARAVELGEVESVSIAEWSGSYGRANVAFDGRLPTRDIVESRALHLLAGRAGEEVFLGEAGTGAGCSDDSDLARTTRLIGMLHIGGGFGGALLYRGDERDVTMVLARNPAITAAVEDHLRELYARAMELVRTHARSVQAVVDELLIHRVIGKDRFNEICAANETPILVAKLEGRNDE